MATDASKLTDDCLFCKIIRGDIPSCKLIETEHCYSFMDIFPLERGHALVIPKYHAAKLHELPADYHAALGALVGRVAKAVVDATGIADYNVLQNNGSLAHQAVHHVHFHVIPKGSNESGLGIEWPAKPGDKDAIADVAKQIVSHL